jgi:hypothetical protein
VKTEESTVLLGVLSPVRWKPAQAEVQHPEIENSRKLEARDQFKNQKKYNERFVIKKELNV